MTRSLFDEPAAPPPAGTPFELDGDERPRCYRPATLARYGTPTYDAYWTAFGRGLDGVGPPGVEHDDTIARYARDGYRLGKLCRPRPIPT